MPFSVRSSAAISAVRPLRSVVLALLFAAAAGAQSPQRIAGRVRDTAGAAVPSATVTARGAAGTIKTLSRADGSFDLDYPGPTTGLTLRATTPSLESESQTIQAGSSGNVVLTLHPTAIEQQVTVTTTRSSLNLPGTANTTYALTTRDLAEYPASQLDDKLRQHAGFELFRRSSSRVQNPTSQGISLRGLGSTAASRTLVLEDNVPMNDAFGGWIHWDEVPAMAIDEITLASGGGSDLYGSSALGGVIDVAPAMPTHARADVNLMGGGQDTSFASIRGDLGGEHLRQLLAGDDYRTAGYIPTAPSLAGPADVPANVHSQAGRSETDYLLSPGNRAFLVGNVLNEARNNGTRIQTNATRLWRYIAGDDWTAGSRATGRVRLFGSDENYRQSFSSINAARTSESLTRLQYVGAQELGASADATLDLSPIALVLGSDVRDIRATDFETPVSIATGKVSGLADTSARQRFVGGFVEAVAARGGWSGALSLRVDSASNMDARTYTAPTAIPQPTLTPDRSEIITSPRLGLLRRIGPHANIHASVFRAFRTPTMNELYRTGQVGQETTQANSQLLSERATGWELGASYEAPLATLSGTYFWTQINRPVSAVFVSQTSTSILNKRQNLGQIVSQGTELHMDLFPRRAVSAALGYQYAHAVVTQFSAQPDLVGNWIPQVPRQSFTAQLRAAGERAGEVTLAARASGHAFDDSANTYTLRSFFELDLSARHDFGRNWSVTLLMDNLLNQRPDVARTPILTLGSPLLAEGGLSFHWSGAAAR
ncbi:MAG TPA: TonB-dependent receptor [Acidobacteriaceae bacterium]|nr:TonB-dependent receptor [Acidobacteriaceae bacterium]